MKLSKTIGGKIALLAVIAAAVSLVLCVMGGTTTAVIAYLVIAILGGLAYTLLEHKFADIGGIVALVFLALAFRDFLNSSLATFMDVFNGITMFGSDGSIQQIVAAMVVMAVSALLYIVSGFMKRQ